MPFFAEIIFVLCLGLVLGSFATALCWRIPRGISWVGTKNGDLARSACAHCNERLKPYDLIPFFSWILLKGKCRYCRKSIAVRYPLIELFTALGCVGVYCVWGFTIPAFIIIALVPLLVALFVIDMDYMILPNQLVFLSSVLSVLFIIYQYVTYGSYQDVLLKVAGMVIFAVIIWFTGYFIGRILKKEALGMGDVKFFAMAGLWLGLSYLPFFLVCSGFFGVVLGIGYKIFLRKQVFPFGPALILSLYIGLILLGLEIVPLMGVQ